MNYDRSDSDPTVRRLPDVVAGDLRWFHDPRDDSPPSQPVRVIGVARSGYVVAVEAIIGVAPSQTDPWFADPDDLHPLSTVRVEVDLELGDVLEWIYDLAGTEADLHKENLGPVEAAIVACYWQALKDWGVEK